MSSQPWHSSGMSRGAEDTSLDYVLGEIEKPMTVGAGVKGGDRQRDDRTPLRLELKTAQVGAPGLPKTATLGLGSSKRGRCNLARALQRGNTPCL